MQIIVAGLGKVGSYLAGELSMEGHDVTAVDINPDHVHSVTSQFDVMGINGNIIDFATLNELDLESADLFIAVAASDEINLLACLFAKRGGCSKTIARVRNPEYRNSMDYLKEQLGLEMIINPELLAAAEMERVIAYPGVIDVDTFSQEEAELINFRIKTGGVLDGMAVRQIPGRIHKDVLVCAVLRKGKAFIPDGDFILQAKDVIYAAGSRKALTAFITQAGIKSKPVEKAMMIGAGKIAYYLAEMLIRCGVETTVIDSNLQACEKFAKEIPEAIVINGDGSDQNLLLEEGLMDMNAFISITGIDEENAFLSMYANRKAGVKTITKVTRVFFDEIFDDLEVDTLINPKKLTAEYIIRQVRSLANTMQSNIETFHKLAQDQVEALEFVIHDGCGMTGIPLQDLPLRNGVLIALILRDGQMILPRGYDSMKNGDSVIVITNRPGFVDITDILDKKRKSA